ncbi:MAG: hypothetical protein U9O85_01270 [Euryarchaeota archaeon]|nr:hypothetical protein [Euryarchaeota archaeon]
MNEAEVAQVDEHRVDRLEAKNIDAEKIRAKKLEVEEVHVKKLQEIGLKKTLAVVLAVIILICAVAAIFYFTDAVYFTVISIVMAGLFSFIIPLVLSFSPKYNLGTKLSKGEVRKSIVIALTVMYIILLSLSFYGPTVLMTDATNYTTNYIVTGNNTTQHIPIQPIGNFTQNFPYVYIIIIGFYFGSRLGERIKMLKELKNLKPLDILQKRYAMGEIDSNTFDSMKESVAEQEELLILHKLLETRKISVYNYVGLKKQLKHNNNELENSNKKND